MARNSRMAQIAKPHPMLLDEAHLLAVTATGAGKSEAVFDNGKAR